MQDARWFGLWLFAVAACGPAVPFGETTSDDGSTTTTDGSGPPGGTTTSTPPSDSTGPVEPEACYPNQIRACTCPDGTVGEQECGPDRVLGPCQCGEFGSSGWWGSSSGWGSSGDGPGTYIPELPPGEVCLSPATPCIGEFEVFDAQALEEVGVCTVIDGSLYISDVETLAPLKCVTVIDQLLGITNTQLLDLSGLESLQTVEAVGLIENPLLISLDLPSLTTTSELFVVDNADLSMIEVPNLQHTDSLYVADNPMLSDCLVADLFAQLAPFSSECAGNLEAGCAETCG